MKRLLTILFCLLFITSLCYAQPTLDGGVGALGIWDSLSLADSLTTGGSITSGGVIRCSSSLWWHSMHISGFDLNSLISGATYTAPDSNTLGGVLIDAASEFLYAEADVHSDWDGATNPEIKIIYEIAEADPNAVGTVDIKVVAYYKGSGEKVNKTQTLETAQTVDGCARYQQYIKTYELDWDKADNVLEAGDKLALIINIETDTSEIDVIMINHIHFRYKTSKVLPEI